MKILDYSLKPAAFFLFLACISLETPAQNNPDRPLPHFLFPGFTKGVTMMKKGESFASFLNYNMVDEIMVTELNGSYRYATRLQDIDTIFLEYKKFVPVEKAFFEVLVPGPVTFFLQNKSVYSPIGSSVGYGAKSRSVGPTEAQRFEINTVGYQYNDVVKIDLPPNVEVTPASVYWVRKNGTMEKFTTEKQLLNIFPEQKTQLKEFIKKEKLNLKVREDVIKLGKYCNGLMK
jgi:hypothetical protein